MEDYKVRYKQDGVEKVTDWLTEAAAKRKYKQLKNEKVLITEWAELSMWDGSVENMVVVESFVRKSIELFGKTLLVK